VHRFDRMMAFSLAIACGVAFGACDDPPRADQVSARDAFHAYPVTVARLVRDPSAYDGQTVRVIGRVDRVVDRRSFVLRDFGLLWAPRVEVVASEDVDVAKRERVQVIGTFRARDSALLARTVRPAR
jgi:hypothetical protein